MGSVPPASRMPLQGQAARQARGFGSPCEQGNLKEGVFNLAFFVNFVHAIGLLCHALMRQQFSDLRHILVAAPRQVHQNHCVRRQRRREVF